MPEAFHIREEAWDKECHNRRDESLFESLAPA